MDDLLSPELFKQAAEGLSMKQKKTHSITLQYLRHVSRTETTVLWESKNGLS